MLIDRGPRRTAACIVVGILRVFIREPPLGIPAWRDGHAWQCPVFFCHSQGSNERDTFLLTRGKQCQARLPLFEPCHTLVNGLSSRSLSHTCPLGASSVPSPWCNSMRASSA